MHQINLPFFIVYLTTWWGEEWPSLNPPLFSLFFVVCLLPLNVAVGGGRQGSVGGGGQRGSKATVSTGLKVDGSGSPPPFPCLFWCPWWQREFSPLSPPFCLQAAVVARQLLLRLLPLVLLSGVAGSAAGW
jgi:hypothetical protein